MSDQTSGIYATARGETSVARGSTLEGFAATASGPGVAVASLQPLTALLVDTQNTRYHIIVSGGGDILIQGGAFFPEPTPARLDGASLGTSLLKIGWIGLGLRMEIRAGGQRIITSAVRSITVDGNANPRPH